MNTHDHELAAMLSIVHIAQGLKQSKLLHPSMADTCYGWSSNYATNVLKIIYISAEFIWFSMNLIYCI